MQGMKDRWQASVRPLALYGLPFLLKGAAQASQTPPVSSDQTHGLARGRCEDRCQKTPGAKKGPTQNGVILGSAFS